MLALYQRTWLLGHYSASKRRPRTLSSTRFLRSEILTRIRHILYRPSGCVINKAYAAVLHVLRCLSNHASLNFCVRSCLQVPRTSACYSLAFVDVRGCRPSFMSCRSDVRTGSRPLERQVSHASLRKTWFVCLCQSIRKMHLPTS